MFLSISKNACTSLKQVLHRVEFGAERTSVGEFFGYAERNDEVVIIDRRNKTMLGRFSGYVKFVVYRDPFERLLSVYHNKVLWPPKPHAYYTRKRLEGLAFDPFLDFVEEALAIRNPLEIDEHVRPQGRCYFPEDVDCIVPIESLGAFLSDKFGIEAVPRDNRHTGVRIEPTPLQRSRIRELYREDYRIVPNYPR